MLKDNRFDLSRRQLLTGAGASSLAVVLSGLERTALASDPVLTYWNHFTSQTEQKGLRQIQQRFAERFPSTTVVSETIPNADYMTKFTAAAAAGALPGSAMVIGDRFADVFAMGALVDVSDRLKLWPRKADFAPETWRPIERDGRLYGVPAFSFVNWMYYRKDYFDEAGISKPPDTLEEFLEAAVKLSEPGKNRYGFGLRGGGGGQFSLLDLLRAFGSPIVQDGRAALDKAPTLAAVRFYSELFTKHKVAPPSAPNDSYRQIMESFRIGQTAMIWHHTGSLTELLPAVGEGALGTALRPRGPVSRASRIDHVYNVIVDPVAVEPGWKWISFWGEEEVALEFFEATGYFPSSLRAAADKRIAANPLYKPAVETLAFAQPPAQAAGLDGWAANSMWPEFQSILVGARSVEIAVDNMIRSLEQALR